MGCSVEVIPYGFPDSPETSQVTKNIALSSGKAMTNSVKHHFELAFPSLPYFSFSFIFIAGKASS
jgi:hypothetical protein